MEEQAEIKGPGKTVRLEALGSPESQIVKRKPGGWRWGGVGSRPGCEGLSKPTEMSKNPLR